MSDEDNKAKNEEIERLKQKKMSRIARKKCIIQLNRS